MNRMQSALEALKVATQELQTVQSAGGMSGDVWRSVSNALLFAETAVMWAGVAYQLSEPKTDKPA